jgi:hypothetical protein
MVIAVYLTNGEGAVIMTLEALVGLGFELGDKFCSNGMFIVCGW